MERRCASLHTALARSIRGGDARLPSVRHQWGRLRGIRRGSAPCGRSVEEVREEQKSVLSNRGARAAVPGSRFSGCPVRQPPLGLPNPQSLRTNGIIPAYASIVKHFRKQFLKQFSWARDRGTMERRCASLRTALARSIRGGGMRGSYLCEINGGLRGTRRGSAPCGRSMEEVREEQKAS